MRYGIALHWAAYRARRGYGVGVWGGVYLLPTHNPRIIGGGVFDDTMRGVAFKNAAPLCGGFDRMASAA